MNVVATARSFEGFQSQTKTVEALPIRIDYQSPRYEYGMWPKGDDWRFGFSRIKRHGDSESGRKTANLDPYAIRDAFETIDNTEQAVHFLSESGRFWPFEGVLWSQIREWQSFFRWLRLVPAEAKKSPDGKKAWDSAGGWDCSFFAQTDGEFTRSRFPDKAVKEIGAKRWREIQVQDRQMLCRLRSFALIADRQGEGSRVSLGWYDPKLKYAPEDWKVRQTRSVEAASFSPFLRIEALNAIEAIAATIYADRLNGTMYRKCKHCRRLFKIESDHEQAFCPAPAHLKSSPCKNAYFQHERRGKERRAIELLVSGWRNGLGEAEIEREASEQGLQFSERVREKALRTLRRNPR